VFSVKIKFSVLSLCIYVCIFSAKAVPEMTYTMSGGSCGTLNPTHSLSHSIFCPYEAHQEREWMTTAPVE